MLVTVGGRRFDLVMHSHDGVIFAEFEKLAPGAPTRDDMDRLSDGAIMGMMVPDTLDALLEAGPEAIRTATGLRSRAALPVRRRVPWPGGRRGAAGRVSKASWACFFPKAISAVPPARLYGENFCRYIPQIGAPTSRVLPAENPLTNSRWTCRCRCCGQWRPATSHTWRIWASRRRCPFPSCPKASFGACSPAIITARASCPITQRLICEQIAMMFAAKFTELVNPAAVEEDMLARREAGAAILAAVQRQSAAAGMEQRSRTLAVVAGQCRRRLDLH